MPRFDIQRIRQLLSALNDPKNFYQLNKTLGWTNNTIQKYLLACLEEGLIEIIRTNQSRTPMCALEKIYKKTKRGEVWP